MRIVSNQAKRIAYEWEERLLAFGEIPEEIKKIIVQVSRARTYQGLMYYESELEVYLWERKNENSDVNSNTND